MTPGEWIIPDIVAGDTFPETVLTLTDGNGDPIDLTGGEVACRVRYKKKESAVGFNLALSITDAAAGEITISEQTIIGSPGLYYYDIKVVTPDVGDGVADIHTYVAGTWTLLTSITPTPAP